VAPWHDESEAERGAILIVDDVAANRDVLRRRYERHGFQITEADGGYRAIELTRERHFDLVLLDVTMPDIDGLEVLKRIRQCPSTASLPMIMVTGKAEGDGVAEAFAAGANDYVTKPVDFVVALARTNTQLELKRAEKAAREADETLRQMNEHLEQRVAQRTIEQAVADRMAQRIVDGLESVEIHKNYREPFAAAPNASSASLSCCRNNTRFPRPVSASWWAI
jgi:PleD family two-component response regulator